MKKLLLLSFTIVFQLGFSQTIAIQSFATGFSTAVEIAHPANDAQAL